jgi:sec-independent protein translocase protein TatA
MGKLFDNPTILVILIVAVILIFGSKRLPDAARGVGRSLRILKAETKGLMTDEDGAAPQQVPPVQPAQAAPAPAPQTIPAPVAQPVQQPVTPPQAEQPVTPPPAPAPDQPQG